MKKNVVIGIGAVILVVFFLGFSYVNGTRNTLIDDEEGILAQEKIIDLSIDKAVKKIQGTGITVSDFRDTLKQILAQTIGEGGRAAGAGKFVQAVHEQYPTVPDGIWRDLAATMNGEYESMASAQASKISRIQAYKQRLRRWAYLPAKIISGFPTIDLAKHEQVIVGATAQEARKTGTLETVDPFGNKK